MLYKGKIMLLRAIYNIIIRYVCVGVRVRAYVQSDDWTIDEVRLTIESRSQLLSPCANNKDFPLKTQINLIFIVKFLCIPIFCCNFAR